MCAETLNWKLLKNFKAINIVSGIAIFDGKKLYFKNYSISANANFTIDVKNIQNGGDYNIILTKTTASDIVVTLPATSVISGSTDTTFTLIGALNQKYLLSFTKDTNNYVWKPISGGGTPGADGIDGVDGADAPALEIVEVTGTYTLQLSDNNKWIKANSEGNFTITVPSGLPAAFNCSVVQFGNGQITIAAGVGVTVSEIDNKLKTLKKNAVIALVNNGSNQYTLTGTTGS